MEQKEILNILADSSENVKNIDNLSRIHILTKHYLLLAEELSENGDAFLQPLKEHRDAYDHLMRIFALPFRETLPDNFDEKKYISENMKKAYGHEYRAFFDTADWLTFICRKFIRENLSYKALRNEYEKKYQDFTEIRKFINDVPFTIAKYREGKDISNKDMIAEVFEYQKTLDKLVDIYKKVRYL